MKKLIQFFLNNAILFLFLVLEFVAILLIVRNNEYQRSVYFSSANGVVGRMYAVTSSVTDYFDLKGVNKKLAEENVALRNEIIALHNQTAQLSPLVDSAAVPMLAAELNLHCISAKVINNSTTRTQNYITLNKGARDGVKPSMGVVVGDGVVGIVKKVSERFSVVIPVLNPEINISSKFITTGNTGILTWNGGNAHEARLNDVPRHVEVAVGDSLITSGLTTNFPEGVHVGVVERFDLQPSDSYYSIWVRLAVDFETLLYVTIIENRHAEEQQELERASVSEL